jgi:hypothetical protein
MSIVRKNCGSGHSYVIDGARVDGVTTLLSEGTPSGGLVTWSARCVAERVIDMDNFEIDELRHDMNREDAIKDLTNTYRLKRQRLAVRGTKVHALADRISRGEQVDIDDEELYGFATSAARFLDDWHVRPILSEQTVGSRQWSYGGTFDLVCDMNGYRCLVDYKTSSRRPHWRTALQLAAYRWADCYVGYDGTEIPMSEVGIEQAYIVNVRDDGYDIYPIESGPDVFRAFLHVAHVAREVRTASSWISDPRQAPTTGVAA